MSANKKYFICLHHDTNNPDSVARWRDFRYTGVNASFSLSSCYWKEYDSFVEADGDRVALAIEQDVGESAFIVISDTPLPKFVIDRERTVHSQILALEAYAAKYFVCESLDARCMIEAEDRRVHGHYKELGQTVPEEMEFRALETCLKWLTGPRIEGPITPSIISKHVNSYVFFCMLRRRD